MKRIYLSILIIALAGCTVFSAIHFYDVYGPANPHNRVIADVPDGHIDYWESVKPVLDNRCVVCHGCYDAPCQHKTTAIEGLERGASKQRVYNARRFSHAKLTRLFEDAHSVEEWREKDFFPVLNERENTPKANKEAGVMYQLLSLKEEHPLPDVKILPADFTFGNHRAEVCPKPEAIGLYKRNNPLWGMPYALPGLNDSEQSTLKAWLEQGARYTARKPIEATLQSEIDRWEIFLNGDSLKAQLANRYIYEHLFLAHIYFDNANSELDNSENRQAPIFFKLVRSSTPPGQPPKAVFTRRPYDDPGIKRVYYRFVPEYETVVIKNHMPYKLDKARMQRWQSLFYESDYEVTQLPDYKKGKSGNPFLTFQELPLTSRYKFMLDEAQFTIMNFVKGPVCRGQVAVNVIKDHFWVFFVNPDLEINNEISEVINMNVDDMELPSVKGDIYLPLSNWTRYAAKEKEALRDKDRFLTEHFKNKGEEGGLKVDLNLIWDGSVGDDKLKNKNAALTIFRHFDSASVKKGLLGEAPQTAWVISYPLLEKIHYLLVAGYDVYGNIGHQLLSRLYMDFLRMDGESTFLGFLPAEARDRERKDWYQDADPNVMQYLTNPDFESQVETAIDFSTDNQKEELYNLLAEHLDSALSEKHSLRSLADKELVRELNRLNNFKGQNTRFLAEMTAIQIIDAAQQYQFFTLNKNNAHRNITSLFSEKKQLDPERNTVTISSGIIGAYPNTFMRVARNKVEDFVDKMISLETPNDYSALLDEYGIRRTHANFWQYSDELHSFLYQEDPIEYGVLDYNRLENR